MKLAWRWSVLWAAILGAVQGADLPELVPLWPGAAPGSEGIAFTEQLTERSKDPAKHDRIYTQVAQPALAVYRPKNPNGVAVIVAPGGGYIRIAIDKEGLDTAAWLNEQGITAFVLRYRLPNEGHTDGHNVPLQDAQRAVRVLRSRAASWGLDPGRIGFAGYSAGGHLAASVTFFHDRRVYQPVDDADKLSAQPDFSIFGYAVSSGRGERPSSLEGLEPSARLVWEHAIEARPGASYPPTFILHADDDVTVSSEHSLRLYRALKQAGTSVEMHVFRRGGHGFGVRGAQGPVAQWPALCAEWMRDIGMLPH